MTISLAVVQTIASMNVVDVTDVFDNTQRMNYPKNHKLRSGENIYQNFGNLISVPVYDSGTIYDNGALVFKDNLVKKQTALIGAEVPKQPESYIGVDTDFQYPNWTHRYIKMGTAWTNFPNGNYNSIIQDIPNNREIHYDIYATGSPIPHYAFKTSLISNIGLSYDSGVVEGSSTAIIHNGSYEWINPTNAKTKNTAYATCQLYNAGPSDILKCINYASLDSIPSTATITGIEIQLTRKASKAGYIADSIVQLYAGNTAMGNNQADTVTKWGTTNTTITYGGSTNKLGWNNITLADIKNAEFGIGIQTSSSSEIVTASIDAIQIKIYYTNVITETIINIDTPNVITEILPETVETQATIIGGGLYPNYYYGFNTIIVRPDGVYARTNVATAVEYETTTEISFNTVTNPTDLGFTYVEKANQYKPFDGKNYSFASRAGNIEYTMTAADGFTTIALGKILCTSLQVVCKDELGNVVSTINKNIDCSIMGTGIQSPKTEIFYTALAYTAEITLIGTVTQIGTILLAKWVNAGMSNLAIKNSVKSYSVFEQDEWGNPNYIERPTAIVYSGTVNILVSDYDEVLRLAQYLDKKQVIMDGSDSNNRDSDGRYIFGSTKLIGRLMTFEQNTAIKDNDIDVLANYSFTLEEII